LSGASDEEHRLAVEHERVGHGVVHRARPVLAMHLINVFDVPAESTQERLDERRFCVLLPERRVIPRDLGSELLG
jgi:hypothetical protein